MFIAQRTGQKSAKIDHLFNRKPEELLRADLEALQSHGLTPEVDLEPLVPRSKIDKDRPMGYDHFTFFFFLNFLFARKTHSTVIFRSILYILYMNLQCIYSI